MACFALAFALALALAQGGGSCGDKFEPRAPPAGDTLMGDVGTVEANAEGVATFEIESSVITLTGPSSVIGRSFVVVQPPKPIEAEEPVAEGKKDSKDKDAKDKDAPAEPAANEPVQRAFGVIGIARMHVDAMALAKDTVETPEQPVA